MKKKSLDLKRVFYSTLWSNHKPTDIQRRYLALLICERRSALGHHLFGQLVYSVLLINDVT